MITLTACQQKAADEFREFIATPGEQYMLIGGWAGCGKSTLIDYLVKTIRKEYQLLQLIAGNSGDEVEIYPTATTNKAATVLGDFLKEEATTIHRLLGLTVKNDTRTGKQSLVREASCTISEHSLVIIDEASFIDLELLKYIDEATKDCKVLLVGDGYQLAPVKSKGSVPPVFEMPIRKVQLAEVKRNTGALKELATAFRNTVAGDAWPEIKPNGVDILQVNGPQFQAMVDQTYSDPYLLRNSARILAWTNKRVHEYNTYIRQYKGQVDLVYQDEYLYTNKPIKTNKMSVNTDSLVRVSRVGEDRAFGQILCKEVFLNGNNEALLLPYNQDAVRLGLRQLAEDRNWLAYFDAKESLLDLRPPHSCTVHKSQGSTYGTVFLDLHDIYRCNDREQLARMMYVAVSRPKDKLVIYGDIYSPFS